MRRRPPALNVAKQAGLLSARFPGSTVALGPNRLTWTGELQPSSLSRIYSVHLQYDGCHSPTVRVTAPVLEPRPDASLPHVYRDGSLCLHVPGEWGRDMLIADSIVPWTAEWLFNYELWKVTGEWFGGGEWPPSRVERAGGPRSLASTKQESEAPDDR